MSKFKIGDHAVYPGHGVGQITAIDTKEILGTKSEFYRISIIDSGMTILAPIHAAHDIGIRPIISKVEAKRVREILSSAPQMDSSSWSRRYREYIEKIKSGNVFQIAECLRDLKALKSMQELSFGERKMLDFANLLAHA